MRASRQSNPYDREFTTIYKRSASPTTLVQENMERGSSRGEMRRIHIIYFLSHSSRVEQPHLFRVNYISRNGVYLRDVKRWLANLRGKEMPEAFAWSYKRRYRNGYVWQDVLEDDLITPISDNEYVLQGSEIIYKVSDQSCHEMRSNEKKACMGRKSCSEAEEPKHKSPITRSASKDDEESHEFSPERSSLTDESLANEETGMLSKHHRERSDVSKFIFSLRQAFFSGSERKQERDSSSGRPSTSSASTSSEVLRSWITCGGVDTKDSLFETRSRPRPSDAKKEIGTAARGVLATFWDDNDQSHYISRNHARKSKEKIRFCSAKVSSVANKPTSGPFCSKCSKPFMPEKMHSHMKSCPGMRNKAKDRAHCGDP